MNYVVDSLFFIDIIIIFNSAVVNDDLSIIEDRCEIAKIYLSGWFWIDLVAILPFGLFTANGEASNLVRFARIGRITKILKLLKLLRLMKLQKSGSFSILTWAQELFRIGNDFRWFFTFLCYFVMVTHVVACIWIIIASPHLALDPKWGSSWITNYDFLASKNDSGDWDLEFLDEELKSPELWKIADDKMSELYLTAFYFTVTTITTVGYGDMPITTFLEKVICIFIMLSGVIAFSLASGSLTNYISQSD